MPLLDFDPTPLGFEANAQLLAVFDLLAGHTSQSPLNSPPPPVEPASTVRLPLARCNVLHLRLLAKTRPAVQHALAGIGVTLEVGGCTESQSAEPWLELRGDSETLTAGQLHENLIPRVEAALLLSPDTAAVRFESTAQTALLCCRDVVQEAYKGAEVGAEDIRMVPVRAFDVAHGGTIRETLGPTGLAALTGFSAMGYAATVTMPNFRQWTEGSEQVEHKQRFCDATLRRPLGRLWMHMHVLCVAAPCHEVVHLFQHTLGQRMSNQLAEHDAYFATAGLAAAVLARQPAVGYPGLLEILLLGELSKLNGVLARAAREGAARSGWDADAYHAWRDSFGAAAGLWNGRNFNSQDGKGTEFQCGLALMLEAACVTGDWIDESDVPRTQAAVDAMLHTFFADRTSAAPGAAFDAKAKRKLFDCNDKPVRIATLARLSGSSLHERIAIAGAEVGGDRARSFASAWSSQLPMTPVQL